MKQQYITILLTIFMSIVGARTFAKGIIIDGIYYKFHGTEAVVYSMDDKEYVGDLVILEKVTAGGETYRVTAIRYDAFRDCSGLTSVTIPNSITTIGGWAFCGCTALTSLTIPNSVTDIYDYAFSGCSGLTSLTIGNGVTSIGTGSFSWCTGLSSVIIPNSVTGIGDGAFRGCSGLTSVTIGNGVTYIGDEVFWNCSGLTSVTIHCKNFSHIDFSETSIFSGTSLKEVILGDEVTTIGNYAFHNCKSITSVTFGNSVASIGYEAFRGCSGLTSLTLPNSVTTIRNDAFEGCSGLTSLILPNSVTEIGDEAFWNCSGLTSLTLPNSITEIGSNVFCRCSGLTSLTIPNSVTTIGVCAFGGCTGLVSVSIPNSVTTIRDFAFKGCSGLTSLTLPSSITEIAGNTFQNCTGLTSLTIPNSVTSIGYDAFRDCSGLTSVTIPNSVTTIGGWAFCGCSSLTSVTIPNSVPEIAKYTFSGCSNLTSLTIGNSVTKIEDYAFKDCSALTSVIIGKRTPQIGHSAFEGCKNLTLLTFHCGGVGSWFAGKTSIKEVIFGDEVTKILGYAFRGCTGLSSVTFGNNVTTIENYAFDDCDNITSIISLNTTPPIIGYETFGNHTSYNHNYDATLYVPIGCRNTYKTAAYWYYFNNIEEKDVTPSNIITFADANVKAICVANWDTDGDGRLSYGEAAAVTDLGTVFQNNTEITSFDELKYFTGLTSIGIYAFYGCSGLTSLTIGNGVTSIGNSAFGYCYGLTSITIPKSVTNLGNGALHGCTSLTSITIPNSVTSIEWDTFMGCSGLISIVVEDGNTKYDSRGDCNAIIETNTNTLTAGCKNTIIPNSVTSIGDCAFWGCSGLTSITIPNSVTTICQNAFGCCTSLASITIPSGVKSIGEQAFYDCSNLTSITIPNSVTSLGYYVFDGCSHLTSVTIEKKTPLVIEENTFSNRVNATLYVPIGSKTAYEAADYWKDFKEIVEIDVPDISYNLTYLVDGEVYKTCKLKEGEAITPEAEPTKDGYTFSGWSEIPETMPNHDVTVYGTFTKNSTPIPSDYKSLDDYIAESDITYADNCYLINPIIDNIKKVYIDLTKGTNNTLYCYLGIKNTENSKMIDLSSKNLSTSNDNIIIWDNDNNSKWFNIVELADNKTYSWLYYNPENTNEIIIDVEAYLGHVGYIEKWQENFGTSCIVNIVTSDTPSSIIPGDANGDGLVNVTDIVATVNFIMEKPTDGFIEKAADLNGDSEVNVTDIVMMVSIIMNGDGGSSRRAAATSSHLIISGHNIQLRNAEAYTAAQFDINLSNGQSISNVVLNVSSDHSLYWKMVDANTYRVVVYSMTNAAFRANSDNLFTIFMTGSQNATICNELLIKADGTTGIDAIRTEAENGNVYDLNGRQVKTPRKGLYIINGRKVVVK